MAHSVTQVVSTLNAEIGRATDGIVDLQVLMPLGLSALALRQILVKGLQIDEIPWYAMAWYAFDSFVKLNRSDAPPVLQPTLESQLSQESVLP